jgi:hypothetical protein
MKKEGCSIIEKQAELLGEIVHLPVKIEKNEIVSIPGLRVKRAERNFFVTIRWGQLTRG